MKTRAEIEKDQIEASIALNGNLKTDAQVEAELQEADADMKNLRPLGSLIFWAGVMIVVFGGAMVWFYFHL